MGGDAQSRCHAQTRVNQLYANLMKQQRGDTSLSPQLQEARWLIKICANALTLSCVFHKR